MELKERYEHMKKKRREAFHGRRYYYNTAADGRRVIGVIQGLGGDVWIVGYLRDNGTRKAVKSVRLQSGSDPDALQRKLDIWAIERGLEEVK